MQGFANTNLAISNVYKWGKPGRIITQDRFEQHYVSTQKVYLANYLFIVF